MHTRSARTSASANLAVLTLLLTLAVAAPASAATFSVNATADTTDADPGDGSCADASGACTLYVCREEAPLRTGYLYGGEMAVSSATEQTFADRIAGTGCG